MCNLFFVLAFVGAQPTSKPIHYDLVEVNHVHDEWGVPDFTQLIFWDWSRRDKCHHVQAWSMMRDDRDKSNAKHRAAFDAAVDAVAGSLTGYRQQESFRYAAKYTGEFVGGPMFPRHDYLAGVFRVTMDREGGRMHVTAASMVETFTQYDREVKDRKVWPESKRRGFRTKISRY